MMDLSQKTIGEIVTQDYRTAFVFQKNGLDYCCGGGQTIERACKQKEISLEQLEEEIKAILSTPTRGHRYHDWTAAFLTDYIVQNHHTYVREQLPGLLFLAEKVAGRHGNTQPVLIDMLELVRALNKELTDHMRKEEEELFPLIKEMEKADAPTAISKNLIDVLETEHEVAGTIMKQLENMTNGFNLPKSACTSYVIYFNSLKEFRDDLFMHVHLENNILFPKVMKLMEVR